jgi:glycosyltransferase involved in cell wall biosynthesis
MTSQIQSGPLVSIIVPTYNYGRYLNDAISSLQSLSYPNWECVIVDDGSQDETATIIKELAAKEDRLRYVWQENARQAAARNNGIQHSRGDYFQFLDADDLIESRKLEQQVAFLEQHRVVDIIYSGVRYFTEEQPGERLLSRQYSSWEDAGEWMPEISGAGTAVLHALLQNNIMVVNAPLLRRSVIDRVGHFDVDLTPVEDWDYLIRCAAAGMNFQFEDGDGIRALVRAHSMSASLDQRRYLQAVLRLRRKIATMELDQSALQLNRSKLAEAEGHLGIEQVVNGELGQGIRQMCKAALADPRPKFKAKWLICAASAAFVSHDRLKQMVTSSLTGSIGKVMARSGNQAS